MNPVDRCAWGRGSHSLSSATCPLSPGALSRVWNVEVKTKVPDRYQTSRGGWAGKQHPKPPIPRRPDNSKVGSVPSRQPVAGVVLHTILCTPSGPLRIYLHVSAPLRSSPGIRTRASWCDPQPARTHHPYPACHPTLLSCCCCRRCFYCFSFLVCLLLLPLRTFLPCPPLLHLFLDRLTASSRLASPSITCVNRPPGQPAHSYPPSRHHWNAQ